MSVRGDVVITGLGVVTPIGVGRDAFARSLEERLSGVRTITRFDTSQLSVHIGGELREFEPKLYVKPRKSLKVMSYEIQMGVASASLAAEDADLPQEGILSERMGVVYGSPMLYADIFELRDQYAACMRDGVFDFGLFGQQFSTQMFPLWMLKFLPNMTASHIGISHGACAHNNSVVLGDVSGLAAIAEAAMVIQRGRADVMLTGGTASRLDLTSIVYRGDQILSKRNHDPAAASRPFELGRDGMVNSEGAGSLVLETRQHAEARKATILGTIVGYATSHCGRVATGNARGELMQAAIERTIHACLAQGDLRPVDIGHVNAHGLSTLQDDVFEARAIAASLGDVPVTAPKSYFGNLGAAAGVVELAASLVSARNKTIPVTLNYEQPDPACPVHVVRDRHVAPSESVCLCLNHSANGQVAALAVRLAG